MDKDAGDIGVDVDRENHKIQGKGRDGPVLSLVFYEQVVEKDPQGTGHIEWNRHIQPVPPQIEERLGQEQNCPADRKEVHGPSIHPLHLFCIDLVLRCKPHIFPTDHYKILLPIRFPTAWRNFFF